MAIWLPIGCQLRSAKQGLNELGHTPWFATEVFGVDARSFKLGRGRLGLRLRKARQGKLIGSHRRTFIDISRFVAVGGCRGINGATERTRWPDAGVFVRSREALLT